MSTTVVPRGRQTKIRAAWETTFGVNPGMGFNELNTYTNDLQRARTLDPDDILGAGFNDYLGARSAGPDVEDASGKLSVPFDLVQIGTWLAMLLGQVEPTGSGPYVHSFAGGAVPLPSVTLEREFVAGAQYDGMLGAVAKSGKFNFKPGKGYNMLDLDLVGMQVLEPYTSTAAGTPVVDALLNRVGNNVGLVKIAGTQVGTIIDGSMTLTNDFALDRYVGNTALIAAAIHEGQDVAVDITARYSTDALRAYGVVGSGFLPPLQAVEFDYVLGAMSLIVVCPNVRFEPINAPVSNGKTITISMKGRGEVGTAAPVLTATLTNTHASQY